jgi:hypothetical protein
LLYCLFNVRAGEVNPKALYLFVAVVQVAVRMFWRENNEVSAGAKNVAVIMLYSQRSGYDIKEIPIISACQVCGSVFVRGCGDAGAVDHEGVFIAFSAASIIM